MKKNYLFLALVIIMFVLIYFILSLNQKQHKFIKESINLNIKPKYVLMVYSSDYKDLKYYDCKLIIISVHNIVDDNTANCYTIDNETIKVKDRYMVIFK